MKPISRAILLIFFLCLLSGTSWALQVTPASPCAIHCLDSGAGNEFKASDSNTYTTDISCKDVDYSTTDAGIKFRKCIDCLQTSSKVDKDESDLKWYIYNLRYTITTCLYGAPKSLPNGTVASQCNVDKACKSLEAPLVSDSVQPSPNSTWDYCTATDGAFMASPLSSCINCLQATEGEVYMSNFLTALEVGCRQGPSDGSLLNLSGSVFSINTVTMTDPNADVKKEENEPDLPPAAIAGIVVGVVVLFVVALGLFFVHFRREGARDAWDKLRLYANYPRPPGSLPYHGGAMPMSQAYRRYYTGTAFSEKAPTYTTAGDYYDRMESNFTARPYVPDFGFKRSQATVDPIAGVPGANNNPTTVPPEGSLTPARTPSPVLHVPKARRSNTPDSFAVRQYLQAAEDAARLVPYRPPEAAKRASKRPFISLPPFPKLRMNKKDRPSSSSSRNGPRGIHISNPVGMNFDDYIGQRLMLQSQQPPSPKEQQIYYNGYYEVPLRSGKSSIYG